LKNRANDIQISANRNFIHLVHCQIPYGCHRVNQPILAIGNSDI